MDPEVFEAPEVNQHHVYYGCREAPHPFLILYLSSHWKFEAAG